MDPRVKPGGDGHQGSDRHAPPPPPPKKPAQENAQEKRSRKTLKKNPAFRRDFPALAWFSLAIPLRGLALTIGVLLLLAGLLPAALLLLTGLLIGILVLLARILVRIGHRDLPC
jgi:hypothetical protein